MLYLKFDKKEINETGFSFYEIDLNDKSINIKTYNYDDNLYSVDFEDTHKIIHKNKREFILNK